MFTIKKSITMAAISSMMLLTAPTLANHHSDFITKAIDHNSRPDADKAKDAARKPAQVMKFSGLKAGDTVIDLFSGKGYYADLFSYAVGSKGTVYTVRSRATPEHIANLGNMKSSAETLMTDFQAKADIVFTALNYHDLVNAKSLDRKAFLKAVADHLKDNGSFVIVDHAAEAGSGARDTSTLHRIDSAFIINELEENGFYLDEKSDLLAVASDDHSKKVFDPTVRGNTDRFLLRFKKK